MRSGRYAVLLVVVAVVLPGALLSQDGSLDIRLFRQINNSQTIGYGPIEFVDQTSIPLFVSIPAGIFVYGALANNRFAIDTGTLLVVSQAISLGTTILLKTATDRPRPFEALTDVKVKRLSNVSGSSFPSGHAAQAFAIATMLAYRSGPALYLPAFVWAGLVGYGRMYVGVHYPSDVVAGMALGTLCSILVYEYRDSIIKTKDRWLHTEDASLQYDRVPENLRLVTLRIPLQ